MYVCMWRDVQNKRVTDTFSNFHEYLECCSRLARDRLRSKGSKKDLISWNAVRIVRFPLMFFPPTQFHISMQKVHERAIFPSIFADLLESHTSPSSFLPRNVCVYVCVCVSTWNGGIWSKRRRSANKYKAIKLVFLRNEIVIGSSFEKYFSFGKNSLGIFLPSLEDR